MDRGADDARGQRPLARRVYGGGPRPLSLHAAGVGGPLRVLGRGTLRRIVAARQDTAIELEIGSALVRAAGRRGNNADASKLATYADTLRRGGDEGVRHGTVG